MLRSVAGGKRWLHYAQHTTSYTSRTMLDKPPTPASVRERNTAVTSYYNQQTIDTASLKVKSNIK